MEHWLAKIYIHKTFIMNKQRPGRRRDAFAACDSSSTSSSSSSTSSSKKFCTKITLRSKQAGAVTGRDTKAINFTTSSVTINPLLMAPFQPLLVLSRYSRPVCLHPKAGYRYYHNLHNLKFPRYFISCITYVFTRTVNNAVENRVSPALGTTILRF
jgi:hypothetical protein